MHFNSKTVPLELAKKLIDYAAELGAKYIRFDIWWWDVEPTPGHYNEAALRYYREVISYMLSKGIKPIAIIGTGYLDWVEQLIMKYYLCWHGVNYIFPFNIPLSHIATIPGNKGPLKFIRDVMIKSEMYFNPVVEIELIDYVKRVCLDLYYASAKGYLTREELIDIMRKCPMIPLKISSIGYNDKIFVQPLPYAYKVLKLKAFTRVFPGVSASYTAFCEICMLTVLEKAYEYAKKVAEYLGDLIDYYQLGNELNHFLDPIPPWYDPAYIAALGKSVAEGDPDEYHTIVNVIVDYHPWSLTLRLWLNSAGHVIDIVAIDHYPGTWTPQESWSHWEELDELIKIAKDYGKVPAIMETGYPSEGGDHTEERQESYIDVAFSEIMKRAQRHYIAFLSWYMLWDEPESKELFYYGWGVLRRDFSKKPAWYRLKDWFTNKLR